MTHTFDIRFVRSGGLAGFFEAPANVFGWRGSGLLSIDAQGMRIEVKRSLVSLLARERSQRISAEDIREVYREGEALRIEFASDTAARATIPFWARDRETAAQIVNLLPTSRTVEIEHETRDRHAGSGSKGLKLLAILGAAAVCGVLLFALRDSKTAETLQAQPSGVLAANETPDTEVPALELPPEIGLHPEPLPVETPRAATPGESAPAPEPVADPVPLTTPDSSATRVPAPRATPAAGASETQDAQAEEGFVPTIPEIRTRPADRVVPIRQGTLAYDKARSLLGHFEEEAAELSAGYRTQRQLFDGQRISRDEFADRLDAFARRWRNLGASLDTTDPALTGLGSTLLAVATGQNSFLTGYATGVRTQDSAATDKAFEDLTRANELLESARQFIR